MPPLSSTVHRTRSTVADRATAVSSCFCQDATHDPFLPALPFKTLAICWCYSVCIIAMLGSVGCASRIAVDADSAAPSDSSLISLNLPANFVLYVDVYCWYTTYANLPGYVFHVSSTAGAILPASSDPCKNVEQLAQKIAGKYTHVVIVSSYPGGAKRVTRALGIDEIARLTEELKANGVAVRTGSAPNQRGQVEAE